MASLRLRINTSRFAFILVSTCYWCLACHSTKVLSQGPENSLNKTWEKLEIAQQYHTGLSIYDLKKGKSIFNYRDDNYFTSASCTKILTMYTILKYMDEKVPAASYKIKGDTIFVWGGGDPGTLFPDIESHSPLIEFLKSMDKKIVFSNTHLKVERYGAGWAWDDYKYNFQCERTTFPIYGNRLWIERNEDKITLTPSYFKDILSIKKDTVESHRRNEWGSNYFYNYDARIEQAETTIPISFFANDIRLIWSEAIGKDIYLKDIPLPGGTSEVKGTDRDSLLKWMMQESDNFIAEQLLLACAIKETDQMNDSAIIEKVLKGPLDDLPDSIDWVDGSGLSRYNQVTPRSLVWVLSQMLKQQGLDYVKSIFPAGGQSGTIRNDFKGVKEQPYLYAKSGSLRHTYDLSGILITNSGKVLVFSWMNNQFPGDSSSVKLSMEKLFVYLRDNY